MLKQKILIRALTLVVALIMFLSSAYMPVSAASSSRPMPQDIRVTWYKLTNITKVIKEETKFVLQTRVNNEEYKLYISFPKEGGFRIYSDSVGFHVPDEQNKIKYSNSGNDIVMTGGDNTRVVFRQKENNWSLDIYYKTQLVNRVTGKQLALGYDKDNKLTKMRLEGTVSSNETFTGLGERFNGVVQNGKNSLLWNLDTGKVLWNSGGQYEDDEQIYSYTNIPLLHSTNGYTVFLNSSYAIEADIAKTNSKKYTLEAYGPTLDMFFWTGDSQERLEGYCALTGYNILPPKWAFSYWAGNSAHYWKNTNGGAYLAELEKMVEGYNDIGTPVQSMFVEGVIYKDNKVHSLLKKYGIRTIAWHDSGYSSTDTALEALPGYSISEIPIVNSLYNTGFSGIAAQYYDFSHPLVGDVIEYSQGKYLDYGTKGAMIDFADAVPYDSVFYNGMTGDEMHNLYSYLYQKAFKELYENHHGNDYVLFARAGFAGTQSLMTKFLGDQLCTFEGLRDSLVGGLTLSLSGFSIWGSDMGALGAGTNDKPTEETYRRWVQWSAFNPLMRSHGHTTRAPWDYSVGAVKDFQKYFWLRENLLNTIYSSAIESTKNATMMASPLMLTFSEQSKLSRVEDEYMFCNDILTAPVTTESALSEDVVLPSGNWTNFWTGKNVKGGTSVATRASTGTIPLYLRAGSVLPIELSENLILADNMQNGERVEALLVSPATGRRDVSYNKDEKTTFKFTTDRTKEGTTLITSASGCSTRAIIAKGISASKVSVDDKALKELDGVYAGGLEGYCVDKTNNTTTIWLPEKKWSKLELTNGGGIAKNLAADCVIYTNGDSSGNKSSSIIDKDLSNSWTLAKSGLYFDLDLGSVKKFNEIQLTWGIDYAKDYLIEISEDGINWKTARQVTDGTGDEEVIRFESMQSAQYIRFSNFVDAQKAPAVLAEVRVYGEEMDFVGRCDVTGNIHTNTNADNDEGFTEFEEDDDSEFGDDDFEFGDYDSEFEDEASDGEKDDDSEEESSWLKKVIRRKRVAGFPYWIIFVIAGAVAVVAGTIVLIIGIKRRKKKTTESVPHVNEQ